MKCEIITTTITTTTRVLPIINGIFFFPSSNLPSFGNHHRQHGHQHQHHHRYHHYHQGSIFRFTCSHRELTKDHVLTSAYVKIFKTVTRNAVNKSVWRKKDCSGLPLKKHAMNIWFRSLRIRAHLSWRTWKHLHVLHVLRTYSTCSYPGYQDTTTYAAVMMM